MVVDLIIHGAFMAERATVSMSLAPTRYCQLTVGNATDSAIGLIQRPSFEAIVHCRGRN